MKLRRLLISAFLLITLSACGGGGGSDIDFVPDTPGNTSTDCVFGSSTIGNCKI